MFLHFAPEIQREDNEIMKSMVCSICLFELCLVFRLLKSQRTPCAQILINFDKLELIAGEFIQNVWKARSGRMADQPNGNERFYFNFVRQKRATGECQEE